ncbi:MAG TPA: DUF4143 domain-containing protein, partial [Chlamydiales bacterium]|nr:DUF4143 domain-containing protein [Chlamydiales bacterium]
VFQKGGDSLMGRYFPYRLHPVSVAEIVSPAVIETEIRPAPKRISDKDFESLYRFGGFPEPYLKRSPTFYNRWKRVRMRQLLAEDLRDLTNIRELRDVEMMATMLRAAAGQLLNYSSISKMVQASVDSIKRWMETLKSLYYCFTIQPWTKNVTRSLLKEPKLYLWDWSLVEDKGARVENLVASHLLKAVHFWTDRGLGEYGLYFLRDKEKREVDFLVTKNEEPWFLVEVKGSMKDALSKSLYYFQQELQVPHAFQLAFDMPYEPIDVFSEQKKGPMIVSLRTFLSQLV